MSSVRFAQRHLLYFLIGAGMLVPATAPAQVAPAPLTLYAPTVWPEALPEGEATDVKFTVLLAGGEADSRPEVSLQIGGLDRNVPMQDDGLGPDLSAGDRIYSAVVRFDPADARAGRCYDVRASTRSDARTVLSAGRRVCTSRHLVGIAASDFSAFNIIDFSDSAQTARVVADEALIRVSPDLGDERIAAIAALADGHVVGSLPGDGIYQIRLRWVQTAEGLRQTLLRLQRADGVVAATPNALGELQAPPVVPVTTSDPLLAQQWGLERIRAKQAWAITTGDPVQLIAVIDTGADFDHPDFWATPTDTDTRFAIDGGGNLVAADCTGTSCVAVSQPLTCHATNSCNAGNAATDTYGHGTVVAGFAGAAADNALGIAGATWRGRLLAVRFATSNATSTVAKLAAGINYARGQGARIISASAGAAGGFASTLLCPGVAAAESEGRLVVAAAGNEGSSTGVFYPAACTDAAGVPTAMPVANSTVDASDQDVIYTGTAASNFGTWISIAAPGTTVLSTARTPAACPSCEPSLTSATGYATVTGTSFSTPLAAGAAGLVLARSPSTTNADLRALLFSTGVALQAPAAHIRRIDVLAALLTFSSTAPTIAGASFTIPENSPAATVVGSVSASDPEGSPLAFAIIAGNTGGAFAISGTGQITVANSAALDFETTPTFTLTVTVSDGTTTVPATVTVNLTNVNEPPTIAGASFTIAENSPAGTAVGTVVASDPEGSPLTFAITAGNVGGAFAISGTGQITVANSAPLDFETTPVFTLTVTASDGTTTVPATVTVNLTNVNESYIPPTWWWCPLCQQK